MLKVGVIGCGKIAQVRHFPEYDQNANCQLAGYFDFNQERAKEFAKQYGGTTYESVEAMLADKNIDAVSVCVANNAHAEITIKALNAGKDVLCEKPMATNLEECEKMVEAAEANGCKLMIGQNQRLTKAHRKAKELIAEGAIGKVLSFRTTFGHGGPETWSVDQGTACWFFDKKKAAMGAMADLGVHKTDLIQYLTGEKVIATTASVTTLDKKDSEGNLVEIDDNAICIYRMTGGIVGSMTASWTFYGKEDNSTVLYGTEGIMEIYTDPSFSLKITKKNGEIVYYELDAIQTNDNQTNSGIIDAFVESITEDKVPLIDGKDVLHAMKAVFASLQSAEEGRTIEL